MGIRRHCYPLFARIDLVPIFCSLKGRLPSKDAAWRAERRGSGSVFLNKFSVGFFRVLQGFPGFFWEFRHGSPGSLRGFYRVSVCIGFDVASTGFYRALGGFPGFPKGLAKETP